MKWIKLEDKIPNENQKEVKILSLKLLIQKNVFGVKLMVIMNRNIGD